MPDQNLRNAATTQESIKAAAEHAEHEIGQQETIREAAADPAVVPPPPPPEKEK